jgi:hypothetical protein
VKVRSATAVTQQSSLQRRTYFATRSFTAGRSAATRHPVATVGALGTFGSGRCRTRHDFDGCIRGSYHVRILAMVYALALIPVTQTLSSGAFASQTRNLQGVVPTLLAKKLMVMPGIGMNPLSFHGPGHSLSILHKNASDFLATLDSLSNAHSSAPCQWVTLRALTFNSTP